MAAKVGGGFHLHKENINRIYYLPCWAHVRIPTCCGLPCGRKMKRNTKDMMRSITKNFFEYGSAVVDFHIRASLG